MITFRDFMELALYDPKKGFYSRRRLLEDFYTAPELHVSFAAILAKEFIRQLSSLKQKKIAPPYFLVEMGSGSGRLARDILTALKSNHPETLAQIQYVLVERTENLLLESLVSLSSFGIKILGYTDLKDLPPCHGIFFSNELLDSFPVHLLQKKNGRVMEVYVRSKDNVEHKEFSSEIQFGELSSEELKPFADRLVSSLEEGERSAVNLEALRWIRLVGEKIKAGSVITVDYGRRLSVGIPLPIKTFHQHQLGDDPFKDPGQKDITTQVDFEPLILEGERRGLKLEAYENLGKFLLDRGILELLPAGSSLSEFKERNQVKTLFHPEGMGEIYKVLIQVKS
ncbi:MAG: SAM-dependent methyltransferase [Elusimicrobia bacterium]|nr:SAM-dependent methyltransferase [Elusimicrobiota bacterium]